MTSGNMKISAVNLQKSVLKGRVWSCSGKLSSVTREALISNVHRASAKCTCSARTNYARVGMIPSASFAPAQIQALQPLWPPRASSTHQTPLPVPARGLVAAAAVSASQLLLPAATLPVPTATLARALWREGGSNGQDAPGMFQVLPAVASQGQGHPQAAPCCISLPVLHPRIIFFPISRIKFFHLQIHLQDLQDKNLQLLNA